MSVYMGDHWGVNTPMSVWRRVPTRALVLGVTGLVLIIFAFVVETAMGSGNGHRYLPVHIVQVLGSVLILLAAALGSRTNPK
jgi:hypothetical protein